MVSQTISVDMVRMSHGVHGPGMHASAPMPAASGSSYFAQIT